MPRRVKENIAALHNQLSDDVMAAWRRELWLILRLVDASAASDLNSI